MTKLSDLEDEEITELVDKLVEKQVLKMSNIELAHYVVEVLQRYYDGIPLPDLEIILRDNEIIK